LNGGKLNVEEKERRKEERRRIRRCLDELSVFDLSLSL